MNEVLQQILAFCEERVAAGDIYVWGGSGQKSSMITESWIRQREAKNQNGAHADQAVQTFMARVAAGKRAFRAYDCSGYISAALMTVGVLDKRRDCDGLYALCSDLTAPQDGALLFRVNSANPDDETHVGIYFGGYQYHSRGRAEGVVKEPYKASYWAKIAWFNALDNSTEEHTPEEQADNPADEPVVCRIVVDGIKNWCNVRNGPGLECDIIGRAKKNDVYDAFGVEEEWYRINYKGRIGYIFGDLVSEVRKGNV